LLAIPTVKFCVSARHSLAAGTAICPLASYLGEGEKQHLCITALMGLNYCKHKLNIDYEI
jgi:hypothetical protein